MKNHHITIISSKNNIGSNLDPSHLTYWPYFKSSKKKIAIKTLYNNHFLEPALIRVNHGLVQVGLVSNPQLTWPDWVGRSRTGNRLVRLSSWVVWVNIKWWLVSSEAKKREKLAKSLQIWWVLTRSVQDPMRSSQIWEFRTYSHHQLEKLPGLMFFGQFWFHGVWSMRPITNPSALGFWILRLVFDCQSN